MARNRISKNELNDNLQLELKEVTAHLDEIATVDKLGHVKPDGTTIQVDPITGVASAESGLPLVTTTGTSVLYNIDLPKVTSLTEGFAVLVKLHVDSGRFPYMSFNGAGNLLLMSPHQVLIEPGFLKKDSIYLLVYTSFGGGGFIVQGALNLNNTLTSTSVNEAATANAVKMVNDKLIGYGTAIGQGATTNSESVVIGEMAKATSNSSVSIGSRATTGNSGVAIGVSSSAANSSVAIGRDAVVLNSAEGVLGTASTYTVSWKIPGNLSVTGTKNFEIPHPNPSKKHTHIIRHGAVESPTTGDTLYRYTIDANLDGEIAEITLPDYFEYLNTNVDVWVNPYKHFGRAYGEVIGGKLLVTCEKAGTYKALVIGTRNDDNVQDWHIKGFEREIGESWLGETYSFEVDEITEITEFEEVLQ